MRLSVSAVNSLSLFMMMKMSKAKCPVCNRKKSPQAKMCWRCFQISREYLAQKKAWTRKNSKEVVCPNCRGKKSINARLCQKCHGELVHERAEERKAKLFCLNHRFACKLCGYHFTNKEGFCRSCLEKRGYFGSSNLRKELIIARMKEEVSEDEGKKDLIPITLDEIKIMRLRGEGERAQALLKAHQESLLKNREQLKREISRESGFVSRIKKRNRMKHDVHSENPAFSEEKNEVDI